MPAVVLCLTGCEQATQELTYRIIRTLPHDPLAYTQGLVLNDSSLFESTGGYGTSSVRKIHPETGEILQIHKLPEEYFGEGLAVVGSQLIQLTWKAGLAFVYDLDSLDTRKTLEYSGEGWGLCFDGESLFMSDGSSTLFRRNPETFEVTGRLTVRAGGFSVLAPILFT